MIPPRELTPEECRGLLSGGVVGRVAMATPMGPRIVPVNYAMHGDAIVIRTSPHSELGIHGRDNEVAFEIDHVDHETHQGWSVVALGRAHAVQDSEELAAIRGTREPQPWAGGSRNLYLGIVVRELTGRRIGSDWTAASL
jgi:uncharacterized protein